MKFLRIPIVVLLALIGLPGLAYPIQTSLEGYPGWQKTALHSADVHLTQVKILEDEVTRLEDEVKNMTERVQRYENKPYLDTKGYQRSSLKLLIGNNLSKIKNLQQQIVWHREEASRMATLHKDSEESYADITSTGGKQNPSSFRSNSRDS